MTEKGDDNLQRIGEMADQGSKQRGQGDLQADAQDRDEPTLNICIQIRKRSPEEMVGLQGSSPPNSRTVNYDMQKMEQK